MLTFGTNHQKITPNGVKRDYNLRKENLKIKCSQEIYLERIVDQMSTEIAELRNLLNI